MEDFTHGDSGRKWFDCADCHHEAEDHPLLQSFDMVSSISVEAFSSGDDKPAVVCVQKV